MRRVSLWKINGKHRYARSMDRFGFFADTDDNVPGSAHSSTSKPTEAEVALEALRTRKWLAMLRDWDRISTVKQDLLKKRCRKSIPDCLRGTLWPLICGATQLKNENPGLYERLLQQTPSRADMLCISLDLPRTYPNHFLFTTDNTASEPVTPASALRPDDQLGYGQSALRNILRAYAVYDPSESHFTSGILPSALCPRVGIFNRN